MTPGRQCPPTGRTCPHRPSPAPGWVLIACVAVVTLSLAVALTAPGVFYDGQHSMISDLGHRRCATWGDRWVCSPRSRWFNSGLVITGCLLLPAVIGLRRSRPALMTVAGGSLGVGLVWLGLVPADRHPGWHLVAAVLALPVPGACLFLAGLAGPRRSPGRLWAGAVILLVCANHLLPEGGTVLPRGTSELTAVVLLAGCVLTAGVDLIRAGHSPTRPAEVGPDHLPPADRALADRGGLRRPPRRARDLDAHR